MLPLELFHGPFGARRAGAVGVGVPTEQALWRIGPGIAGAATTGMGGIACAEMIGDARVPGAVGAFEQIQAPLAGRAFGHRGPIACAVVAHGAGRRIPGVASSAAVPTHAAPIRARQGVDALWWQAKASSRVLLVKKVVKPAPDAAENGGQGYPRRSEMETVAKDVVRVARAPSWKFPSASRRSCGVTVRG